MDYTLFIPKEVQDQWDDYVRLVSTEIAVMGLVTTDHENKRFVVDHIFLVPQKISGSEVDFIDRGLHYAIDYALALDRLDDLRFCAHSHVNMATNWSGTDEDMIDKIGLTGVPWFISLVSNKRHEHTARFDYWLSEAPFFDRDQVCFNKLTVEWETTADKDDEARIKEIEQFCRKAEPPAKKGTALALVTTPKEYGVPGPSAMRKYDDKRFKNEVAKERGAMTVDEFVRLAKKEKWAYIEDMGPNDNGYGFLYFHNKGGTIEARRLATDEMVAAVIKAELPGDMISMFDDDDDHEADIAAAWGLLDARYA